MFLSNLNELNWTTIESISNIVVSVLAILISIGTLIFTRREANRLLEEQNRAYLTIYSVPLITNRSHFYLVIRNYGQTQATITDLEIDDLTLKACSSYIKDDIYNYYKNASLAPNQSFTHLLLAEDLDQNHVSQFSISYKSGKKVYKDNYDFNIQKQHNLPSIGVSSGPIDKQFLELYQDYLRRNL